MNRYSLKGILLSATVLLACGDRDMNVITGGTGAAGATGATEATASNSNLTATTPATVTKESKTYSDKSGVIYGEMYDLNRKNLNRKNKDNVVLASANPEIAKKALNGTLTLTVKSGSESNVKGSYYTIERSGKSSSEVDVTIKTHVVKLASSGDAYVAVNELTTGTHRGLQSAGTKVSNMPSGIANYEGKALIRRGISSQDQGTGTFLMSADFTTKKASITATTPEISSGTTVPRLFFKGDNMTIDMGTGAFSTQDGKIGVNAGASEAAIIQGYFAGEAAAGVHGLAYSKGTTSNYTGAFHGLKK